MFMTHWIYNLTYNSIYVNFGHKYNEYDISQNIIAPGALLRLISLLKSICLHNTKMYFGDKSRLIDHKQILLGSFYSISP